MKKFYALFLSIILTISMINIDAMAADEVIETGDTIVYTIPEEQVQAEHQRQLKEHIKSLGISEDECIFLPEGISLLNDMDNYKTESSEVRYASVSGWAGNQPPQGVSISSGGLIHYSPSGGGNVSVSVAFNNPFGSVSVSIPLGRRSDAVTGYSASIPPTGNWKLWVRNVYSVQTFIGYQKYWVDDFTGYVWREFTRTTNKAISEVNLTTIRVK